MSTKEEQVKELKDFLSTDDFYDLTREGDTVELDSGIFTTIKTIYIDNLRWTKIIDVITQIPEGSLFKWTFEDALTENSECIGPAEYGTPELIEVQAVEKTITIINYVPVV